MKRRDIFKLFGFGATVAAKAEPPPKGARVTIVSERVVIVNDRAKIVNDQIREMIAANPDIVVNAIALRPSHVKRALRGA